MSVGIRNSADVHCIALESTDTGHTVWSQIYSRVTTEFWTVNRLLCFGEVMGEVNSRFVN